jgi:hypothetical protein
MKLEITPQFANLDIDTEFKNPQKKLVRMHVGRLKTAD